MLERALALLAGNTITVADLQLSPAAQNADLPLPGDVLLQDHLDQVERQAILEALQKTRFNRTAAARLLGVTFRSLRYRMERLGHQRLMPGLAGAVRQTLAGSQGVDCIPSPNCDERPAGHGDFASWSCMPSACRRASSAGNGVDALFTNQLSTTAQHPYYRRNSADLRVSAHFLIRRDGRVDPVRIHATNAPGTPALPAGEGASAATISPSASSSKAATNCRSRPCNTASSPH